MDRGRIRSDLSVGGGRTEVLDAGPSEPAPVLKLRLTKPKSDKKVEWQEGTVDNEHMNKKKSKCCCIYKKKLEFGESSSSDDEECENCYGHPEKRTKIRKNRDEQQHTLHYQRDDTETGSPIFRIVLKQDDQQASEATSNQSTEEEKRTETSPPLTPLEPPSNNGLAEDAKPLPNSVDI